MVNFVIKLLGASVLQLDKHESAQVCDLLWEVLQRLGQYGRVPDGAEFVLLKDGKQLHLTDRVGNVRDVGSTFTTLDLIRTDE